MADLTEIERDAEQYPPLTPNEEIDLAKVVSAGAEAFRGRKRGGAELLPEREAQLIEEEESSSAAVARLLQGSRRLALSLAKGYGVWGHDPVYVYEQGMTALAHVVITARWDFDWTEGTSFSHYATAHMRKSIDTVLGGASS